MSNQSFGIERLPIDHDGAGTVSILEFQEHEKRRVQLSHLTYGENDSINRLLGPARRLGLLDWSLEFGSSGTQLIMSSSSTVGFTTCRDDDGRQLFVRVRPKIEGPRLLDLLLAAGMLPRWDNGQEARLDVAGDSSIVEWTLRAFHDALRVFIAKRGIRARHEKIDGTLTNQLRGRLKVSGLLKNFMRGRPDQIPAIYPSLDMDHAINRRLLWAVHIATLVSASLDQAKDLVPKFEAIRRSFSRVSLVPLREIERRTRPRLDRHLSHYVPVLELAQFVIEQLNVESSPGNMPAVSVALDMNDVYQRAFFNGLRTLAPNARDDLCLTVRYLSEGRSEEDVPRFTTAMRPDLFIPASGDLAAILLDTKWKNVLSEESVGSDSAAEQLTIKGRPEDIYQLTSYAVEYLAHSYSSQSTCFAALLYPAYGSVQDLERCLCLGETQIRIRLMSWNLALKFDESIRDVWTRIRQAATTVSN